MKFKILLILLTVLCLRATAQFNVTGIATDYNTFWSSNSANASTTARPDRSHNLLAFTWNGITFSTGVNDARLTSNGVTFQARDFRAFPIDAVPIATSGSSTYVGLGQLQDGVNNGPSIPAPFPTPATPAIMASFLTDGPKGLDLGTGIANIAAGNLRFNLSSVGISASAIGDNVPDVVVTQVAAPGSSLDSIYFIDANGAVVGDKLSINHNNTPVVGKWMPDFYNPNGTIQIINSERDIRLWAADLSSFGITSGNVAQATALIYKLNGMSDVAFVAFNVPSISVATRLETTTQPSSTINPGCCGNTGTSALPQQPVVQIKDAAGNNIQQADVLVSANILSGPAGAGVLTGTTTVSTNSAGQAVFSNLIMPCEPGDYTLQFTSSNLEPASSNTITVTKLTYYVRSGSTGNLSALASWATGINGTGSAPSDFGAGKEFVLDNSAGNSSFATGSNWTVTGKLIIPSGKTMTITASTTTTLSCDIDHAGTIQSGTSSTLVLNGSSAQTLGGTSSLRNFTVNNAAGVIVSGATTVNNTISLTAGSLTLNAAALTLNGSISRSAGNINASSMSSSVTFSGSSLQQVPSGAFSGNIRSLTINNAAGVNLNTSIAVTGNLAMTSGNLILNGNNLSAATISGGSASSYIRTNGAGRVTLPVTGGGGSLSFPVGNSTFNPVTITNNNTASDQFAVRVLDELYVNSTDGEVMPYPRIVRTWNIQKAGSNTGSGLAFAFNWSAAQNNNAGAPAFYHFVNGWYMPSAGTTTSSTTTSLAYTGYTGSSAYFGMISSNAVMPLVWKQFTATPVKEIVKLFWQTSSEQNTSAFFIERSSDENSWSEIGTLPAAGNSSSTRDYSWNDLLPLKGNNYYRIRQVDIDGRYTYSTVRKVNFAAQDGFAVLGNPVKNGSFSIRNNEAGDVSLLDMKGQLVWKKYFAQGTHVVNADKLSAGIYLLRKGAQSVRIVVSR